MNGTEVRALSLVGEGIDVSLRDRHSEHTDHVRLQPVIMTMTLPSGGTLDFESTIVVDALGSAHRDLLSLVRRVLWVDFTIRMRALGLDRKDEAFWQAYESDERANALLCSYSYARTLHRAQGGEWKSVIVDGHSLMPVRPGTSRQAYSAITRAKEALYLRSWPRSTKVARGHGDLAEAPLSILQRELRRSFTYRPLKNATTAVQIESSDGSSRLLVNVFDGAKQLTVSLDRATPEEKNLVEKSLKSWAKFETVRDRHEVPARIEDGARILESLLDEMGIDLIVVRPGNATRNIEFHAFHGDEYASFRGTWTDQNGLNLGTFAPFDSSSQVLTDDVLARVRTVFSA